MFLGDADPTAQIAEGVVCWELTRIRERAVIGAETKIGRCVYIDHDVVIGSRCKIQNGCNLYAPAIVGSGVFLGPGVMLLNDRHPRAINVDGSLASDEDWEPHGVIVGDGASIGAASVVMAGVEVGPFASIGARSLILADVPEAATVYGVWKGG